MSRSLHRPLIALAAAYAVALQAFLAAIVLATQAGAGALPPELCLTGQTQRDHAPFEAPCCISPACCHAAASADPATPPPAAALAPPATQAHAIGIEPDRRAACSISRDAQQPRAPPA